MRSAGSGQHMAPGCMPFPPTTHAAFSVGTQDSQGTRRHATLAKPTGPLLPPSHQRGLYAGGLCCQQGHSGRPCSPHTHVHIHTHTHTSAHMHSCAHTLIHTHVQSAEMCVDKRTHMCTHAHTCKHTHTHACARTQPHVHTQAHSHTQQPRPDRGCAG